MKLWINEAVKHLDIFFVKKFILITISTLICSSSTPYTKTQTVMISLLFYFHRSDSLTDFMWYHFTKFPFLWQLSTSITPLQHQFWCLSLRLLLVPVNPCEICVLPAWIFSGWLATPEYWCENKKSRTDKIILACVGSNFRSFTSSFQNQFVMPLETVSTHFCLYHNFCVSMRWKE